MRVNDGFRARCSDYCYCCWSRCPVLHRAAPKTLRAKARNQVSTMRAHGSPSKEEHPTHSLPETECLRLAFTQTRFTSLEEKPTRSRCVGLALTNTRTLSQKHDLCSLAKRFATNEERSRSGTNAHAYGLEQGLVLEAVPEFIEGFYNRTRSHSSLGYLEPPRFRGALLAQAR